MQVDNRLLDDLARVASSALGALSGAREEIEARLRDQFERVLSRMDVVSREEFEVVKAMAAKAREENDALAARVAALEAALAGGGKAKSAPAKRRRSAGKTAKSAASATSPDASPKTSTKD
jgi:BMFP domain-containing protein YqiC